VASYQLSFNPSVLQKNEGKLVGLEFPSPLGINAVIDTGASMTVVNPEVAATCKLRATGFATVASIEKTGKYPQHAAWIRFPGTNLSDLDGIPVIACKMSKQPYSCLIGRDIFCGVGC